jgi:hypothetical protein
VAVVYHIFTRRKEEFSYLTHCYAFKETKIDPEDDNQTITENIVYKNSVESR